MTLEVKLYLELNKNQSNFCIFSFFPNGKYRAQVWTSKKFQSCHYKSLVTDLWFNGLLLYRPKAKVPHVQAPQIFLSTQKWNYFSWGRRPKIKIIIMLTCLSFDHFMRAPENWFVQFCTKIDVGVISQAHQGWSSLPRQVLIIFISAQKWVYLLSLKIFEGI